MPGEPLRVDGGRGDDQLQVGPAGQQLLEVAEQEVDVQAPLVRLVDDDRVVGPEHPVPDDLVEQDAVGHQLDQGVRAGVVAEPDRVADGAADRGAGLLGDPFGQRPGGDPSGLGVADRAAHAAADLQADLRQLGRFPGAGLAGDDDHLVRRDRGGQVVDPLATPAAPAGSRSCGTAARRRAILASRRVRPAGRCRPARAPVCRRRRSAGCRAADSAGGARPSPSGPAGAPRGPLAQWGWSSRGQG